MEDRVGTGHRRDDVVVVEDVHGDRLSTGRLERRGALRCARDTAHLMSGVEQRAHRGSTDRTRRAGDEASQALCHVKTSVVR
jgi:hypothetical protein